MWCVLYCERGSERTKTPVVNLAEVAKPFGSKCPIGVRFASTSTIYSIYSTVRVEDKKLDFDCLSGSRYEISRFQVFIREGAKKSHHSLRTVTSLGCHMQPER